MVEVLLWLNFCSTFSTLIKFVGPSNTRIARKIKPTIGLSHILAITFDWSKSYWPNIINKFQASSFNVLFDKGHNLKSLGFLNQFVLGKRMTCTTCYIELRFGKYSTLDKLRGRWLTSVDRALFISRYKSYEYTSWGQIFTDKCTLCLLMQPPPI